MRIAVLFAMLLPATLAGKPVSAGARCDAIASMAADNEISAKRYLTNYAASRRKFEKFEESDRGRACGYAKSTVQNAVLAERFFSSAADHSNRGTSDCETQAGRSKMAANADAMRSKANEMTEHVEVWKGYLESRCKE